MGKEGGREGGKVRAIHTTNSIRDPPRRERRKLPRMKTDREGGRDGKVEMVALRGGWWWWWGGGYTWPQISQPGRKGRESAGRWVKDAGVGERRGKEERDRWMEVRGRRRDIDRGGIVFQALTAKNMFPSCR